MDITGLATKDNADEGKWMRVELYGEKQDLWLKVIGADSDVVQKYSRDQIKKINASTKKDNKLDNDAIDELLDNSIEDVICRVNGIAGGADKMDINDPVILNGETLGNDEKSYRLLFEKIPALKSWVTEKSNDRLNFLS